LKILPSEHELYETAAELKEAEFDIPSRLEETQPERLDMQFSAVGEQFGGAQEEPVRTQELLSANLELLPSEHERSEPAAGLTAAELDITSQQQLLSTMLCSVTEGSSSSIAAAKYLWKTRPRSASSATRRA